VACGGRKPDAVINGVIFFASPAWTGSTKGVCGAAYAVDARMGTERWR